EQQREAIKVACTNNVSIISGGPGVGKTTIINAVLKIFQSQDREVKLCAPTGTAAKKMGLATGHYASTIHSLLGIDPIRQEMRFDEHNPLECDLLIVDEVSMIDIELMASLMKAIGPSTAILFVGDKDQLPSIGPGNVLKDLILSKAVEVVFLTEIYRQAQGSRIITVARQILAGDVPNLKSDINDDFFFIETKDPQKCQDYVSLMVTERIPNKFGLNPVRDIQVLAPMKNGLVGINALNEVLQEKLNPKAGQKVIHGTRSFSRGDKVIQNRNDYDREVFNGDIGFIHAIDRDNNRLEVDFDGRAVEYEFEDLDSLDPAFAITIHKSQGSEYQAVVIPLMLQHRIMLQRKLVYTGITRGKGLVVVIGEAEALARAVRNSSIGRKTTERVTRLGQLLLTN
ncbi:MAG: AAA family ATPase, partial [Rhodobacteraceae bacterium]|nr:AAA family ATPase [Paracoccaceae bacterium]